jgi:hypothetical protein
MLFHAFLQEQLMRDRQAELVALARRRQRPPEKSPYVVEAARALLPALAHRLLGIPAPSRPAGCGC